jgi:hypothetical protein
MVKTKRVSVSVPVELYGEMKACKVQENWSAVAADGVNNPRG